MLGTFSALILTLGSLQRSTSLGVVVGERDAILGTDSWLGIPYAAPPIGEGRWMPPRNATPWSTPRHANHFGASCAQIGSFQGPGLHEEPFGLSVADAFGEPVGSEDCLTLNIWRPTAEAGTLPVIVFIHGGANVAGYTADPLYHGARLAVGANAVVVTLNYRLGVFGWFAHPSLDPVAGNLGLLDIIKALEFVRSNARVFGGDPQNVTVVGQSAGAVNAFGLMVSPLATDLFHKVVALSGALRTAPLAARHAYANEVLKRLLLNDRTAADTLAASRVITERGPDWARDYLRSRTAADLVRAAHGVPGSGFETRDGVAIPKDPEQAVRDRNYRAVPLWIGEAASEGKFFVQGAYRITDADRFRKMLQHDPTQPESLSLSDVLKPDIATAAGFAAASAPSNAVITGLIEGTLQLIAAEQPNVYASRFSWESPDEPWRSLMGSMHGMDLPFLFGNFGPSYYSASFGEGTRSEREALSRTMMSHLAAFVRTGDPNFDAHGAPWRPYPGGGMRLLGTK
ncbi:MAG: carboxylesterase family protein [Gemmatimonadaceae bacterium]